MPSEGAATFADILRHHRVAAGLTQEVLAERAGLSVYGIQKLERGATHPYRDTAQRLAVALGLGPDDRPRFLAAVVPVLRHGTLRPAAANSKGHHSLPVPVTSFIGREREIAEVTELLRDPAVRLLTLVGPGGTGKTRLAVEVAGSLSGDFADGVFLIDLAPLSDPGLVASTIAKVLGVREVAGQALLQTLQNRLRDEQLLLVPDNFEHLLAGATVITSLLSVCPRVKVLATSRTPLRLYGEHELNVPPLGLPDLQALDVITVARAEAVQLFVDRVKATRADFRLDKANTRIVGEICVRLDGLPLAIELAAARVRVLPPRALLSRLNDRLSVLTGGAQTMPIRHQTLRATLDWSFSLLAPAEQDLLGGLAVFAGGWTLEAAETVCSEVKGSRLSVLDNLERLVRASLVHDVQTEHEARFQMLETVREYALEQLEASGEGALQRRRHAMLFAALAEASETEVRGAHQTEWLERLDVEHNNLRAALRWCVDENEADLGLRIASAISRFWRIRGCVCEGLEQVAQLLRLAGPPMTAESRATRQKALYAAGSMACVQRDCPLARSMYQQSLDMSRESGDRRGIAESLVGLGLVADLERDYELARTLQEQGLTIFREIGDRWWIAVALTNLAVAVHVQGDLARARSMFEESMSILRHLGDRVVLAAGPLNGLGWVALDLREYELARALQQEALTIAYEVADPGAISMTLEGLAAVAAAEALAMRALRLAGAAARLRESIGVPPSPTEQNQLALSLETARDAVGNKVADAAWAAGRTMALEDAVAEALEYHGNSGRSGSKL